MVGVIAMLASLALVWSASALREDLSGRFTPTQVGAPNGLTTLGTLHRCRYSGPADNLEKYLNERQMSNPDNLYYGKTRRKHYFQHLFSPAECTNGLPTSPEDKTEGKAQLRGRQKPLENGPCCFAAIKQSKHCGSAEDWSVIAPDEYDGPGIMWRNERSCNPTEVNANVSVEVDFFCPKKSERIHLHRCSFDGAPTPVSATSHGDSSVQTNPALDGTDGYYEHIWKDGECTNGLPPAMDDPPTTPPTQPQPLRCAASLRWAESCGSDHDWEVIAPGDVARTRSAGAGVRWYSRCSMSAFSARVAVDYFCARGPTGTEFPRRLHRCRFAGSSTLNPDTARCENEQHIPFYGRVRHAGQPPPGRCMLHHFSPEECSNGLPKGECVTALHQFKECGEEKDWTALAPGDRAGVSAGVEWYNGLQEGPCGDAAITVDYYCHAQCVRRCQHGGILDAATCTCHCPPNQWWTGVECHQCGASDSDCRTGFRIDPTTCRCVNIKSGVPAAPAPPAAGSDSAAQAAARAALRQSLWKRMEAAKIAHASAAILQRVQASSDAKAQSAAALYTKSRDHADTATTAALESLAPFLTQPCASDNHCPIGWLCPASAAPASRYCEKSCASDADCPVTWACAPPSGGSGGRCARPCSKMVDCPQAWTCPAASAANSRMCKHP